MQHCPSTSDNVNIRLFAVSLNKLSSCPIALKCHFEYISLKLNQTPKRHNSTGCKKAAEPLIINTFDISGIKYESLLTKFIYKFVKMTITYLKLYRFLSDLVFFSVEKKCSSVQRYKKLAEYFTLQCNKTLYVRNLRMFIKGYSAFHAKPFQPSLMFADKAGAYLSEAPFRCSPLG